jgi:hypothetical protein
LLSELAEFVLMGQQDRQEYRYLGVGGVVIPGRVSVGPGMVE